MKTEHQMKMQKLADNIVASWRKSFLEDPDNMPPGARRIMELSEPLTKIPFFQRMEEPDNMSPGTKRALELPDQEECNRIADKILSEQD